MPKYVVTFINKTPLPILIETWQPLCIHGVTIGIGLSEVKSQLVNPGESIIMDSESGEWLTNTYFYDKNVCKIWIDYGYEHRLNQVIGNCRVHPYASNLLKHSWMCNNDFEIIYCNHIATFITKNENIQKCKTN